MGAENSAMVEPGKQPRRRWFQFSLRTLFVLMTVVVGALVVWRSYLQPYRQQRQTMALVRDLGGSFKTTAAEGWQRLLFGEDFQNVVLANLSDSDEVNQFIEPVVALPRLEALAVGGWSFTDKHLARLRDAPALRYLVLDSTAATDAAIAEFRAARQELLVYVS
jgi:hypothetical protein